MEGGEKVAVIFEKITLNGTRMKQLHMFMLTGGH